MKNIIEIRNLTYKTKKDIVLNNINLDIKEGEFISIIGPNDSGKTTLAKTLTGLKKYLGTISTNGTISIVFDNPDNSFIMDTVYNDILFTCKNKHIKDYEEKIKEIAKILNIESILFKSPNELSEGQKQKVALANALIIKPNILILDEALTMIDNVSKSNIYAYLQKLNKEKNLTIINITNDLEDTLYGHSVIIINEGKIIKKDTVENIYQNEDVFTKLKLKLPFIVELSNKLKLYGLIDKIYFNSEDLIDKLW